MTITEAITFIVPVNNKVEYEKKFLSSPLFHEGHPHEILVQLNFCSAAHAYNAAIDKATNDLMVFAHQDIWFPESWTKDLRRSVACLAEKDPSWGVLGCYGVTQDGPRWGYVYDSALDKILGTSFEYPKVVQTLDEIVLILRKSSKLYFDNTLPHFHFYGADICMTAKETGKKCYAISAFCIHNNNEYVFLPKEFYHNYLYIKRRWKKYLPIRTTCTIIDRFNRDMYKRKLLAIYEKVFKRNKRRRYMTDNPEVIYKQLSMEK